MATIAISDFLRSRLGSELPYSHFDGSGDELLELVQANFDNAEPGYREGVLEIPLDPEGFHSPICKLKDGDTVTSEYKSRIEGEKPRLSPGGVVGGKKTPARGCSIILYSRETLEEGGTPSTGADYDVIMIQARAHEGPEPMNFITMLHNYFGSDGGTDPQMTPEEFLSELGPAFRYANSYAMLAG